jgi:hypothetical protein
MMHTSHTSIRHRWHPVVLDGRVHWHHWIITEYPLPGRPAIGSDVRVAYETLNADSIQVPTTLEAFTLASQTAGWVLAPAEVTAFRNLKLASDGSVRPPNEGT